MGFAKRWRDWPGSVLGILTFLGGVALLLLTFRLAHDLFVVPPSEALGLKGSKELNVVGAGNALVVILVRILLLFVMGFVGSMVANRGVSLYSACLKDVAKGDERKDTDAEAL